MSLSAAKATEAVALVHSFKFMAVAQKRAVFEILRGEEGAWIHETMVELAETFNTMPKTYEQDDIARDEVKAYIHLFNSSQDWYITEKDMEPEQLQAYGMKPNGNMGYINMVELAEHFNIEVDFHFEPTKLVDLIAK